MEIVIATRNIHKMREFREMVKSFPAIDLLSLHDFPDYQLPEFEKETFEENARQKALHATTALQKPVIADDSGLVIPFLGGAPGVASKNFAGREATDQENCQKVLTLLKDRHDLERAAYLICTLAYADSHMKKIVSGSCEGEIVEREKGHFGYGYDAIFRKYDYDKTFSELSENIRVRISHRRKAFDKLILHLQTSR